MRFAKLIALLMSATLAVSGTSAFAADYTLTISSWTPPTHGINAKMWPKFVEMVEEATDTNGLIIRTLFALCK